MPMVTVRYWAAAKQAAGVAEEKVSAETLAGALGAVVAGRQPGPGAQALQTVLGRCSFLVDGDPAGGRAPESVPLREAAVIEVLPPFAGG
jgi:molybdopterin synthase sulfur carrier subunit